MAVINYVVSGSESVVNSDFEVKSLIAMGTSLDCPLLKLLGRTFDRLEKDVLKDIENKTTFVLGQVNKDNNSLEQKLVSDTRKWTSAKAVCKQEGGYLINIDSQLKALDVNSTLTKMSLTNYFWIDGTRTLPGGEWRHDYGSQDTTFNIWVSGEPSSNDDCKAYGYGYFSITWYLWGKQCSASFYFICEIA